LVVRSDYVRADDTSLKVLDRDHVNGVKRGHMWAFVAERLVAFYYAPDWKAEESIGPQESGVGLTQMQPPRPCLEVARWGFPDA
jgi:hypothetical protein